jgi:hypothetical protein
MDPPKSPWSYPHMMQHHAHSPPKRGLERALPARFTAADVARQRLEDRRIVSGGAPRRVPITRGGVVSMAAFRRSDSQESTASSSSNASSFGLGFLRGSSQNINAPVAIHRELAPVPSRLSMQ